jgi:hypothetical protein
MSSALDIVVDAFDWAVDGLRWLVGLPALPPELLKLEFEQPPTVRVPARLRTEMRRTFHAFLRIEQDRDILFEGAPPRNGTIIVTPLTGALIRAHLKQESRHPAARHSSIVTEAFFAPLPYGPPLRIDVVSKILFGNPLACGWHAPMAERVRLAAIEDANVADHLGPPSGQILLHPTRPGRLVLQFTAESEWGQTTITRTVEVVVPKLRITLLRLAVQAGHPGQEVWFEWRTFGADSVWLISPACEKPQRLRDTEGGVLAVTLGTRPAEFRLIAKGYGGAETSVLLRAVPQPFACLESD